MVEQINTDTNKKVMFSAIKPTGNPTLGNYIGAMKYWADYCNEYDCIYAVADLHAITVNIEPKVLRENTKRMFALLIATGIDPDKSVVFLQSQVSAHSELCWLLNCYTQFGEAKRMTQFKDKSQKNPDNINVGLFDYPVLMAADILLYQADFVPVGHDQLQHVELCRDIANRFNNRYSPTFTLPEGLTPKTGGRIYSLLDPTSKMGKSDTDDGGAVFILDEPDVIARKFKRAVTDCDATIRHSADKAGISNLLNIYAALSAVTVTQAEQLFEGKTYAEFKSAVADCVIESLAPVREKYKQLRSDDRLLEDLMRQGKEKAEKIARKTLSKVYRKIGFVQ